MAAASLVVSGRLRVRVDLLPGQGDFQGGGGGGGGLEFAAGAAGSLSAVSWAWGRELKAQKPDSEIRAAGVLEGRLRPRWVRGTVVTHRGLAETLGSGLG